MIQTTNNANVFFKDNGTLTFIYGAGNPGRWVAYYMRKCNMDFEGFIDKAVLAKDCILDNRKIIHPGALSQYGEARLKIIVAIGNPNEALADLHWYAKNSNLFCLVPLYNDFITTLECSSEYQAPFYGINELLSYFRRQLVNRDIPTIISNSCVSGFIYNALGAKMISPTVNTYIKPADFLKICETPREYFSEDMVFDHWTYNGYGARRPVCRVKDIEVLIAHSVDAEKSIYIWNKSRKWINWENLIYILDDKFDMISCAVIKKFCELPEKHMCIISRNINMGENMKGIFLTSGLYLNHFHMRDVAIENWFDLVGWINNEFEI